MCEHREQPALCIRLPAEQHRDERNLPRLRRRQRFVRRAESLKLASSDMVENLPAAVQQPAPELICGLEITILAPGGTLGEQALGLFPVRGLGLALLGFD